MWTKQQQSAIDARAGNLIVSASAGSGKTAVLIERVLKKVCDEKHPTDIDRFLIVTFTNAASSEIREKISGKIAELLAKEPENLHLQRQLVLVNRAKICTIHSFCLDLIKQNFHLLDLPPYFRVGNDSELKIIKEKQMVQLLEDCYQDENREFLTLVEQFSKSRDDRKIGEILLFIYEKTRVFAGIDQWYDKQLKSMLNAAHEPVFKTPWGRTVREYLLDKARYLTVLGQNAVVAAQEEDAVAEKYASTFLDDLQNYRNLFEKIQKATYSEARNLLQKFSFNKLPVLKNSPEYADVKARTGEMRKEAKEIVKSLGLLCENSEEEIQQEFTLLYPSVSALFTLTEKYVKRLDQEKRRRGICDFSDIEQYAFRLLADRFDIETGTIVPTLLAAEISAQYDEIFIDEYQDTNQIQDLIFAAVAKETGNLFMVGDIKQSIYRFRLAMPEIFLQKINTYPLLKEKQQVGFGRIVLPHNFRSALPVVDTVNFIFGQLMSKPLGDTDYLGNEELLCGAKRENIEFPAELLLADCEKEDEVSKEEQEAQMIVQKIRFIESMGEVIFDKAMGTLRKLRYSDVAVLMLYPSRAALTFASVFRQAGIAAICDTSREFLTTYEVSTVLSMLKVIDNPHQDIALVAVLKSPMFCFTPDMLAEIRMASGGSLYKALLEHATTDEPCNRFVKTLRRYRLLSSTIPVHKLLWQVLTDTGFFSSVSAMENGGLRQENLRLLYEYAKEYEKTSFQGLFSFNMYITQLLERGEDFESAGEQNRADCVRIMSIHKAKGLEFPVCFISCLTQNFNQMDLRQPVLLDSALGVGAKLRDMRLFADFDTFMRQALILKGEKDMQSELVRVLYVAMTRPRQILILTAATDHLDSLLETAASAGTMGTVLDKGFLSQGKNFLYWILAACIRHPSAHLLRRNLTGNIANLKTDSQFSVKIEKMQQMKQEKPEEKMDKNGCEMPELGILEVFKKNMQQEYRYQYLSSIPSKVTVTELSHKQKEGLPAQFSQNFMRPQFILNHSELNAAERGNALHAFFQYADIFHIESIDDVKAEKQRLTDYAFLNERQIESIKDEDVLTFCQSEAAHLVKDAVSCEREKHFNVIVPADEVMDFNGEEVPSVLLQGTMDCVAVTEHGIVILDYKTDRVQSLEQLRERYAMQLALYAKAAQQIYGLSLYKAMIYSTYLGDTLTI